MGEKKGSSDLGRRMGEKKGSSDLGRRTAGHKWGSKEGDQSWTEFRAGDSP